jgi:hypothetical protein
VGFFIGGLMETKERKNYLVMVRNTTTGAIEEKANVFCFFETAQLIVRCMMDSKKGNVKGQIIEGNRNWIGDFSVKPIWEIIDEPQR